jgi:hypothetical protein
MAVNCDYGTIEARVIADFITWLGETGKLKDTQEFSSAELVALLKEYDASNVITGRFSASGSATGRFTGNLKDFMEQARHSTKFMSGQRPPFGHGNMLRDTVSNTIQPCARCGVPIAGGGVCDSCESNFK